MSKPPGTTAVAGTTIESGKFNSVIDDLYADGNVARPVSAGGTGAANEADARTNLGAAALAGNSSVSFNVAAATANDHATSRAFADARYDRITTSPTALANGATIPGAENGRFYSMALPTAQTATLPSTSGLADGFSVVIRAVGTPAGYQTAWISGGGKNISYRNVATALFHLIGQGETFRFTWLSGLDVWLAGCVIQPGQVQCIRGHNGTTWSNGITSLTSVPFNTTAGLSAPFNTASTSQTLVPVAGVYSYRHRIFVSAAAGGGASGTAYLIGSSPSTGSADGSEDNAGRNFILNQDLGFINIYNERLLAAGNIVSALFNMSDIGVQWFPGSSIQVITLVSR